MSANRYLLRLVDAGACDGKRPAPMRMDPDGLRSLKGSLGRLFPSGVVELAGLAVEHGQDPLTLRVVIEVVSLGGSVEEACARFERHAPDVLLDTVRDTLIKGVAWDCSWTLLSAELYRTARRA